MKRLSPIIIFIITLSIIPSIFTAQVKNEMNFIRASEGMLKSPEETIKYFVECLMKNDFNSASQVFGIYEIPENIDFKKYSDYSRILAGPSSLLPSEYTDVNKAILLGYAATSYKSAIMSLCGLKWSMSFLVDNQDSIDNFIVNISPNKFNSIKYNMIDMESIVAEDRKASLMKELTNKSKAYNADSCKEYEITLLSNSKKAVSDLAVFLKYKDNWYILSMLFDYRS
jgi:hypothetical protein